jgi:GT2 family glycosyltransferase
VDTILHITEYPDYEIIIVDNDSREPETLAYYQRLRQTGKVRIAPFAETFNYSRANNLGAGLATGEYLLFLNNDTKPLTRDWLNEMVRWAERPGIGVVGAKLLFPDGTIQHFGVTLGLLGPASHLFMGLEEKNGSMHGSTMWYRNVMAVTGACLLVPTPVFRGLEGFDEKYRLVYSDVDICVRAVEDGWRVVCTPFARLLHVESSTRQQETPETDYRRALKKLKPYLEQGDPCYSPNLSLLSSRPEFRAPGELDTMERIRWKLTLDGYSLRGGGSDGGSLRKK